MKTINLYIDGNYFHNIWKFMVIDHLPFQYLIDWNKLRLFIKNYISIKESIDSENLKVQKIYLFSSNENKALYTESFIKEIESESINLFEIPNGSISENCTSIEWQIGKDFYTTQYDYAVFIVNDPSYQPMFDGLRREGVKSLLIYLGDATITSSLVKSANWSIDFEYFFNAEEKTLAYSVIKRKIVKTNFREEDKRFYKFAKTFASRTINFYIHRSITIEINIKNGLLIGSNIELKTIEDNPVRVSAYLNDGSKYYLCFTNFETFKIKLTTGIEFFLNTESISIDCTLDTPRQIDYYLA